MRIYRFMLIACTIVLIAGCNNNETNTSSSAPNAKNERLAVLFENYYNARMAFFPIEATLNGDSLNNDRLEIDFTDGYRAKLRRFFTDYQDALLKFNRDSLNENDRISYDIFKHEMEISLQGLDRQYLGTADYTIDGHTPFQQFWGLPISMGQMGSGSGTQPFNNPKDYDNWFRRASMFPEWVDSAIVYFRKGIADNYVLPEKLVIKMIPQMRDMVVRDVTKSIFWGPISKLPGNFSDSIKSSITHQYTTLIKERLSPAYSKIADFLQKEYLPKARKTTGISAVPGGSDLYSYLIRYWTTTNKTPDEIYNTGLAEVKRIRGLMDSIKNLVGFKGDLQAFFASLRTDPKLMPYKTADEILQAFHNIQTKMEPQLKTMFGKVPRMKFEIRQTEAFRAASASAEYKQGLADGSRPGVFYIPILDPTKFNITSGMESLFLHEAIPGHHYQTALTIEDTSLPKFRRYLWYGAYGEGWALYCESLGKELGLYTDPYQYMGALGDEMHRAIRLVVDVGMHTKNMTREEAIKYMMDNEAISEEGAVAEIERYMAIPGQALSYKIGALKIRELRDKYQKELGDKFKLADFHDEFLHYGCMPLDVLERSMDEWAKKKKLNSPKIG